MVRGYPLPTRLRSWWSVVSSPSGVRKRVLVYFELEKKNDSGDDEFDIFCHFLEQLMVSFAFRSVFNSLRDIAGRPVSRA